MTRQRHTPADAPRLWTDPVWIAQACNVYEHPGYRQGRQTTRVFGRLMVEELHALGGVEGLTQTVTTMVNLPLKEFAKRVPSVEVKKVPKSRVPTDRDAGEDAINPEEAPESAQRPIVLPTLLRRALSAHASGILDVTGDHLLPDVAIAYRPGKCRVVERAILDVARAVRSGFSYWGKLDICSFFPSVPWAGLESALLAVGYPNQFTKRVMAIVRGGLASRVAWSTWAPVHVDAGTQAGLRESSILANIFLADLDRRLLSMFGEGLFYRRYSDDLLLLGRSKEPVRKAIVEIERWVESQAMQLKGIAP